MDWVIRVKMTKITLSGLKDYDNKDLRENIILMKSIYSHADSNFINIPTIEQLLLYDIQYYFLLNEASDIVGVGAINLEKSQIQKLFIREKYRKKGYATAFIKEAEKILKDNGYNNAIAYVKYGNFLAGFIWNSLGYNLIPYDESNSWKFMKELN